MLLLLYIVSWTCPLTIAKARLCMCLSPKTLHVAIAKRFGKNQLLTSLRTAYILQAKQFPKLFNWWKNSQCMSFLVKPAWKWSLTPFWSTKRAHTTFLAQFNLWVDYFLNLVTSSMYSPSMNTSENMSEPELLELQAHLLFRSCLCRSVRTRLRLAQG